MSAYTLPQRELDSPLKIGSFSSDGRHGVPNSLREALLQQDLGEAALVLDVFLLCGYLPNKSSTYQKILKKLAEHGFTLGRGLIRRALASGVFKMVAIYNGKQGRPELLYFMPDIMDLVKRYAGGKMVAMDTLLNADLVNLKKYRQGLYREFIRRAPGIYSRRFLAERLGISSRTTRNYDPEVNVYAIRRLSRQDLRFYSDWREMILRGKRGLNWLRIEWNDGRYLDGPLMCGVAEAYMWKPDSKVYFVTQLCNRYFYSAAGEGWADYQLIRKNDDERCFPEWDRFGLRGERVDSDPISHTLRVDPKAYKDESDPIPKWLPPEMAARRIVRNPFAAPRDESVGAGQAIEFD